MNFKYIRLYSDLDGESHFAEIDAELSPIELVPSSTPLFISSFERAMRYAFYGAPSGWTSGWHPSRSRNLFVVVSGTWEIKASDGEVRILGPRETLLVEDTRGKGHQSRVLGKEESLALMVQLEES